MSYSYIFIGGLHRSGTTPLCRLLGSDDRISIFRQTGVTEDEGQFLQSVYPVDSIYGGVGCFSLNPDAHFTENSAYVNPARTHLFNQWCPYWDLSKSVLVEKTPANIIRSRFLQAVFPNSIFVFIIRHPVPTCMATSKWTGAYARTLLTHWLRSHELLFEDLSHLERYVIVRYEDLVANPGKLIDQLEKLLGFRPDFDLSMIHTGYSDKYYKRWKNGDFLLKGPKWKQILKRWRNVVEITILERKYEIHIRKYGYSFSLENPVLSWSHP